MNQHQQWQATEIRRPDDVPAAVPLSWQTERLGFHANGDTAADALAVIALRESIRRDAEAGRGLSIRDAVERGASWAETAAALDVDVDEARELLRGWAQRQHNLYRSDVQEGRAHRLGLNAEEHAAVLGLCALTDRERVKADDGCVDDCDGAAMCTGTARPGPASEPQPVVRPEAARYAEELRANPGTASSDGHAGWECTAGASLHVEATTPGPGRLGTLHGVIYACPEHRAAAEERVTVGGEYRAEVSPAPASHRWDPWPCGHVTAYKTAALTALTAQEQR